MAHRFYADDSAQAGHLNVIALSGCSISGFDEKTHSSDSALFESRIFYLSPEDTLHAQRVLRLREGAEIELFAEGKRFSAVITGSSENRLAVKTLSLLPSTEPGLRITLYQGLPKADKMEWIIQKSVELGVVRIVPVIMSRCVVRLESRDVSKKLERWRRIAREAGKQSGRCAVPEISDPLPLKQIPGSVTSFGLSACAVPWEDSSSGGPLAFFRSHPAISSLGLVIGPEGGISYEEIGILQPSCQPITLGPRILRTETAGLAAASAFLALYGEMEMKGASL